MLPREIEKKEELVALRKREVEKRENSEERAVRDFQIPWFVRGFEINRFGPPQIQIHGIQTDQTG